ncbi:NSUN2, partial [Symbiodinium pilosum]
HYDAPIRTLVDIYGPDMDQNERVAAQPNGMRVAGSVRDPIAMIVSAYCYHHRGEELGYVTLWPPGLIMTMGPEDPWAALTVLFSEPSSPSGCIGQACSMPDRFAPSIAMKAISSLVYS